MKTKTKTVYQCEFCKRNMFVKPAMEKHEKFCYMNPANDKACSCCIHLKEIESEYYTGGKDRYGDPKTRKSKGFVCKKLNLLLYPLKVERLGLVEKYPETFEDQKPMPNKCESFESCMGELPDNLENDLIDWANTSLK